ncbi:uncharacterized protein LOC141605501 [Silene latifolia]|uniref:uncharacterized protein LOC141605501 n=1 Tax=Silene latifolia TaxID=37657 RepID=UPI003D784E8B
MAKKSERMKDIIVTPLTEILAKQHIEEIRRNKFSIGGCKDVNPLTKDLHRAVTTLSAELYTKDVHFLMELIQNAEDNEYETDVEPTLEIVFIKKDITGCGAPATLLIFNNEVGFSKPDMSSICSIARSTKKDKREQGFIGEKGIGFKSVFLVSKEPHIVSNGYKVKFSSEPDPNCGIGYIVPEWVADKSFLSKIHGVYGTDRILPTTIIVLPLKPEKVEPVREQLNQLHPELLLFLSKIKKLKIRSSNSYYKDPSDLCAVSISHETEHISVKSKRADSRIVQLSAENKSSSSYETCQYYIWRQSFPVKAEIQARGREDVKEWVISLAFPFGERLTCGTSCSGIFAFLPTRMVTKFPFLIQADFLLASSRESILLDSRWNVGILNCVPTAFVNAFTSFVKEGTPLFSTSVAFQFLPIKESPISELNDVRESIRSELLCAKILPCETFREDSKLCNPLSGIRILPKFRELLIRLKESGICLAGLASLKNHPVHASLDMDDFDEILDFLGVPPMSKSYNWYEKCISSCKLINQVSDSDYVEMLTIFSTNEDIFTKPFFLKNHVFKYIGQSGEINLCSASKTKKQGYCIRYAMEPEVHSWLNKVNLELKCPGDMYFLPNSTAAAVVSHKLSSALVGWLSSHANIVSCSAVGYFSSLHNYIPLRKEQDLLLKFTHFLYQTFLKGFLPEDNLSGLIAYMPVIDGLNTIRTAPHKILVPAEGSKWARLSGPRNPFSEHGFHDIGSVYSADGHFAGEYTPTKSLTGFLTKYFGAQDLPHLLPPDIELPVASSGLTNEQAFLLLDWIKNIKMQAPTCPKKFISSVRDGKWMKTHRGYNSPSKCVLPHEIGKRIFEMTASVLHGYSVLDETFYGNRINSYVDELQYLGVTLGLDDLQTVATRRFAEAATSEMSKDVVISLLTFIGFLKERNMVDDAWLTTLREGRWLRTSRGCYSPNRSVFLHLESESEAVSILTSMPVIDVTFYGSKLETFTSELALLGIKSELEVYDSVPQKIVFPENPASFTSSCGFFILNCIRRLQPTAATGFIHKVKDQQWLKSSTGFNSPVSTIFPVSNLACLLNIVEVPVLDIHYYGESISSYMSELKSLGVALDFDRTLNIVVDRIHTLLSSSKLSPCNILSLLGGIKTMCSTIPAQLSRLCAALSGEALFKTRHGYLRPTTSILSNQLWSSIALYVDLPTIDDSYYGFEIYEYKYELEALGVIVGLEEGASLVAKGLKRPIKAGQMIAEGALTLLQTVRVLMSRPHEQYLLEYFLTNIIPSEFLRTPLGDRVPSQCILLQTQWKDILQDTNLTYLDDNFYGTRIFEYKTELQRIGVRVDEMEVSRFLFESLYSLTETSTIKKCYRFFLNSSWVLRDSDRSDSQVWIPDQKGSGGGQWVSSRECIVHDRDYTFHTLYHCLENYYEDELLPIFSRAFGVVEFPAVSHYMLLYDNWLKRENHELTAEECSIFWGFIIENWNSSTKDFLKKLTKLPSMSANCNKIQLSSKENLFLPDDLFLKNIFTNLDECPPFVWLPRGSIASHNAPVLLHQVYAFLEVKSLSKSVELHVKISPVLNEEPNVNLKSNVISRGLIKLLLCYLASFKVNMAVKARHQVVSSVLNLSVSETTGPISVNYKLVLPGGGPLEVESQKLVHWELKSDSLFIEKSSYKNRKLSMKFGSYFSQELAEGLLSQEKSPAVNDLQKIIQLGLVYDFEEDAVEFLITRENLELVSEDERFLDSAFPSDQPLVEAGSSKRFCPLTPMPRSKKLRW